MKGNRQLAFSALVLGAVGLTAIGIAVANVVLLALAALGVVAAAILLSIGEGLRLLRERPAPDGTDAWEKRSHAALPR